MILSVSGLVDGEVAYRELVDLGDGPFEDGQLSKRVNDACDRIVIAHNMKYPLDIFNPDVEIPELTLRIGTA